MIPLILKIFIYLLIINYSHSEISSNKSNKCLNCDIINLNAEPSFRTVKLSWNYYSEVDPIGFNVKFCELSIWNTSLKCQKKSLRLNGDQLNNKVNILNRLDSPIELSNNELNLRKHLSFQTYDKLVRKNKHHYEAFIYDLRTLTNYTFEVFAEQFNYSNKAISKNATSIRNSIRLKPKDQINSNNGSPNENIKSILIETKGFSAKTERCLSNSSDVIINTGPLFNGKISVENSSSEECAIYGNRSYTQEVYHLTILHDKCGSRMNNSRIETMIIVHENKDILTHNARRFLVVCNFLPESYTFKASVSMPTNLLKRKDSTNSDFNNQLNSHFSNQLPELNSVTKLDLPSLNFINKSNIMRLNEIKRNKRPVIINRMQRKNHPGTLQEQFYKQKQRYINTYMSNRVNRAELNNEVIYNFEKLTKNRNIKDARYLLDNQSQHSIVYNTYQQKQKNARFEKYFTMIMVSVGTTSLFVIIIFNFISIPKIWSNQPHYRRKHHLHQYYNDQKNEQCNKPKKKRVSKNSWLSLDISNLNALNDTLSSNISSNQNKNSFISSHKSNIKNG